MYEYVCTRIYIVLHSCKQNLESKNLCWRSYYRAGFPAIKSIFLTITTHNALSEQKAAADCVWACNLVIELDQKISAAPLQISNGVDGWSTEKVLVQVHFFVSFWKSNRLFGNCIKCILSVNSFAKWFVEIFIYVSENPN